MVNIVIKYLITNHLHGSVAVTKVSST